MPRPKDQFIRCKSTEHIIIQSAPKCHPRNDISLLAKDLRANHRDTESQSFISFSPPALTVICQANQAGEWFKKELLIVFSYLSRRFIGLAGIWVERADTIIINSSWCGVKSDKRIAKERMTKVCCVVPKKVESSLG